MKLTAVQKSKQARGICILVRCSKPNGSHDNLCDIHRMRRYKKKNPIAYTFNTLRCNAKRRGKLFNLTLKDFKEFISRTGYMEKRGRHINDLNIDRIDNSKGYEIGNIQILTVADNLHKQHYVDKKIQDYELRKAGIDPDSST